MIKSAFSILAAAAVTGIVLAPGVASAAPAVLANSSTPGGVDPDTSVTFTVTTGAISLTAPVSSDLGPGAPGTTITGTAGPVVVTDDRAADNGGWLVTASASDWTTGVGATPETIPATDVGYDPGSITTTGTVSTTGTAITLANSPAAVVTATGIFGNNTATWTPALAVAVPAAAVGGIYTATLTQSLTSS
jgi:hypothetical protein